MRLDGSFVMRGLFENISVPGPGVVDGSGNVVFFTPPFQKANTDAPCAALQ